MAVRLPSFARVVGTPETSLQTALRLRQAKVDSFVSSSPLPPPLPVDTGVYWPTSAPGTPVKFTQPSGIVPGLPTTGGVPSGTNVGGQLVNIGLDWLRSRIIPGGSTTTTLVPSTPSGCPQGQVGIPPACFDFSPGGGTSGGGMMITPGEAVMGRYGAALQPQVVSRSVSRCLPGMVLGNDGLCYNRRDVSRTNRKWVPGRKPLLTGGDLNAIARASRAANKMKVQQKRLQKLGLLAKPKSSRSSRGPTVGRFLPAGTTVIDTD